MDSDVSMHDAEHIPADKQIIDAIEARYGDGAGSADVSAYLMHELAASSARNEYESLMHAATPLQIQLAFVAVETDQGMRFVRIDKLQ